MSQEPPDGFRLDWGPTWPEKTPPHTDFDVPSIAKGGVFCRIFKSSQITTGPKWRWSCCNGKVAADGYEETARLAALKAEAAYFQA